MSIEKRTLAADANQLWQVFRSVVTEFESKTFVEHLSAVEQSIGYASTDPLAPMADKAKVLTALHPVITKLVSAEAHQMARYFGIQLNLLNVVEAIHRSQRILASERYPDTCLKGSLTDFFSKATTQSPDALWETVVNTEIELVFTAHPTEVMRYTSRQQYRAITELLTEYYTTASAPQERFQSKLRSLCLEIWLTPELRSQKPTPLQEAKAVWAIISETLLDAVPNVCAQIDSHLLKKTGKGLPLSAMPIKLGSWMGGDRDGNPLVTAATTRLVVIEARRLVAQYYHQQLYLLWQQLPFEAANDELTRLAGSKQMPYRAALTPLTDALATYITELDHLLANPNSSTPLPSFDKQALLATLKAIYASLDGIKAEQIAKQRLLPLIRQVQCFGMALLPLDIREEAKQHRQLMSEITSALQLGRYEAWSTTQQAAFITEEMSSNRPLVPSTLQLSEASQRVWDTFKGLASLPRDALGAYIISMTQTTNDILLVTLLQKVAGVTQPLRVVPLFETEADLQSAPTVLNALFQFPGYLKQSNYTQEVMIGYSDSTKDAGVLAGALAQYEAQAALVELCDAQNVKLTLFHGRGGTVGRGGAPTYLAIQSLPQGAVNQRFRVTEQGEMIRHKFGALAIAERSLGLYLTAVWQAQTTNNTPVPEKWRTALRELSQQSAATYRQTVFQDPAFNEYFERCTPIQAIGQLTIGSRPAKRAHGGVETLRAIPWVFSWMQNRLNIPAWLGSAHAFQQLKQSNPELLEEMLVNWPFFRAHISLMALVISKSCPAISFGYEPENLSKEAAALGETLRQEFNALAAIVSPWVDAHALQLSGRYIDQSLSLRDKALVPLHVLQACALHQNGSGIWLDKVMQSTLAAIASGMRNTG